jgi:ankyrin repeat protein
MWHAAPGLADAWISDAETPLMLAAEEDRPDVVRALLLHRAHAEAVSRQTTHVHMFLVRGLIDNPFYRTGHTALSLASRRGNINAVAELLRLGAFAGHLIAGFVVALAVWIYLNS